MFGEKSSRFELKMHWGMPPAKEGGNPFSRDLSYPVVFKVPRVRGRGVAVSRGRGLADSGRGRQGRDALGSVGGKKPASQSSASAQAARKRRGAAPEEGGG